MAKTRRTGIRSSPPRTILQNILVKIGKYRLLKELKIKNRE
jgi:hypothetical protein